jgi:hypothetical protein
LVGNVTESRRGLLSTAIQLITLLILLAILAGVGLVLLAMASLTNVPTQFGGGVASQASRAVSAAQQVLQNATDPNHPPAGLMYDAEFSSLQVWHVGEGLPGGTQYVVAVQAVRRRDGTDSPDTALYAVMHAELRQPRETRIFGRLLRSDSDPHDHVLYKGETFRIGRALYRVNWISQTDNALAAGALRQPDSLTQPLRFEYE